MCRMYPIHEARQLCNLETMVKILFIKSLYVSSTTLKEFSIILFTLFGCEVVDWIIDTDNILK